jgi:hypothetical protein
MLDKQPLPLESPLKRNTKLVVRKIYDYRFNIFKLSIFVFLMLYMTDMSLIYRIEASITNSIPFSFLRTLVFFLFRMINYVPNAAAPIHEAGHIIFRPFGQIMHSAGGSLFEVLFPLILIIYFLKKRHYFSAAIILFWLSGSLHLAANYIGHAQTPFPAGSILWTPSGFIEAEGDIWGDWTYVLTPLGLLGRTLGIAKTVHAIGHVVFILGIPLSLLAAVISGKKEE